MSSEISSEAVLPAESLLSESVPVSAPAEMETARALRLFALVALTTVVADQLSKYWIRACLPLHGPDREIVPGWLRFSHILNEGAAWGMLSGQRWFLIGVTLVVMLVVSQMAREFAPHSVPARVGLGLILGGALGNLIDRIAAGAVTDFIDLETSVRAISTFPIFNLADSALTVGIIILIFDILLHRRLKFD